MSALPTVTMRYFLDRRLNQLRNVRMPHDTKDFANSGELDQFLNEFTCQQATADASPSILAKQTGNAVAIGSTFYASEKFAGWHEKYSEEHDGTPGIWNALSRAAADFTAYEVEAEVDWNEADYMDAVDNFVDALFELAPCDWGSHGHTKRLAARCISDTWLKKGDRIIVTGGQFGHAQGTVTEVVDRYVRCDLEIVKGGKIEKLNAAVEATMVLRIGRPKE